MADPRVYYTLIEDGAETVLIVGCHTTEQRMKRLVPKGTGEIYFLQTSKYTEGAILAYRCSCGRNPCRWDIPPRLEDGDLFRIIRNWAKVQSGEIPLSSLPDVFKVFLPRHH